LRTLRSPVTAEFLVRKSRFIARAAPIDSQAAALTFLQNTAEAAATHNCWAWRLDSAYRFSDDGEPAGTAGRPILAAIEGKQMSRIMVVVTRYFGGIKLGAGGLVRAYSTSTARCLDQGQIVEIHPVSAYLLEASFEWTGAVHIALEACSATKLQEQFSPSGIRLKLEVRDDCVERLRELLRNATRDTAKLTPA
jgi:uncharacterized YigZ family protein